MCHLFDIHSSFIYHINLFRVKVNQQLNAIYGKKFQGNTFMSGIENDCSQENVHCSSFLNNECLLL